jgi:hypothetical protein
MPVELVRDALDLGLVELVQRDISDFFDEWLEKVGFAAVGIILDVKRDRVGKGGVGAVRGLVRACGLVVVSL